MFYKNIQESHVKNFCIGLGGLIFIFFVIPIQSIIAQDLVFQDTTIATTETYTANNSITIGPNFIITSNGNLTLKAVNKISFMTDIFILKGGQLYTLTGVAVGIEDKKEPNIPTIQFSLSEEAAVLLEVYNSTGQLVETLVNKSMSAGHYNVKWDASNMPSGIYFYKIKAGNFRDLKKMILLQ
jgi:flagellar hook assembly protein FlgD